MDPLTILGATAASTQLAVQAAKSIIFLMDLRTKMKTALVDVQQYTIHVEQLINLTELFKDTPSLHTPIAPSLQTCLVQAQKIFDFMQKVTVKDTENWFRKSRKKLRVALKDKEINQMFERLEREKTSLMIAIAQVDGKLLHSVGLDVQYSRNKLDEVSAVIKDTARDTTTVVNTLTNMNAVLANIQLHVKAPSKEVIPSQPTTIQTFYSIPNRLVLDFIGREDVLNRIAAGFSKPKSQGRPRIVAIIGLGGQGKTQIALEYCKRVKETNVKAIFWIDSMSKAQVLASFEKIANLIKDPGQTPDNEQSVGFVMEKLRSWPEPWLLIFDNHDDPSAFVLRDYFPEGDQGQILVTSRNFGVGNFDRDNAIELEGLSENEAVGLLLAKSCAAPTEPNLEEGKAIVKRLGYHALAIAQAGSYILLRKLNLGQFMLFFEKQKDHIMKHTLETSEYRRQLPATAEEATAEETTLNVFTTWELSFQLLQASNQDGERKEDLLTLFAFFDSKDISEELFRIVCNIIKTSKNSEYYYCRLLSTLVDENTDLDHDKFENILVNLSQMTLIQPWFRDEDGNCHVSLHPLVRDWIRLRTNIIAFQDSSIATANILTQVLINFDDKSSGFNLPLSTRLALLSHINAHIENYNHLKRKMSSEAFDGLYSHLKNSDDWFCGFLNKNGRSGDAETMARRMVAWREVEFGVKSEEYSASLYTLADIVDDQGNVKEAESLLRKVIQVREDILGPEHTDTLSSLNNLAIVLKNLKKYEEAEEIHRRVLRLRERTLGGEHPFTLTGLNNLALVLNEQGKYEEAEEKFRRVLKIKKRILGSEHPSTLTSLNNLALVLSEQGKNEEAEEIHRRELKLCESILGSEHPSTLTSYNNLALVLKDQGNYQEAEEIGRHVIKIREKVLGAEHLNTLESVWNLARNLEDQERNDEALPYFERAAAGSLKGLGADHLDTLLYRQGYSDFKEKLRLAQEGSQGEDETGSGADSDISEATGEKTDTEGVENEQDSNVEDEKNQVEKQTKLDRERTTLRAEELDIYGA